MKHLLVFLLVTSFQAGAVTFSSVYEGQQFQLNGFSLVQADETPQDFYILPNQYRIKRTVRTDKNGDYIYDNGVQHRVEIDPDTKKEYSVYKFRFDLQSASNIDILTAGNLLKMKVAGANLKGMAAPCGLTLSVPGFSAEAGPGEGKKVAAANPDVPYVEYSISSTQSGQCNSFNPLPKTILVTYRVPISQEPLTAEALTSNVGIGIPPMTLLFPYKYKDTFVIHLAKRSTLEQLQALAGFTGTIQAVTGRVQAGLNNLVRNLHAEGHFHMDCHSPDEVCNKYLEMGYKLIEARLLTYTAIQNQAKDLVVADQDKDASMFKIGLGLDYKDFNDNETFDFDFSTIKYSSISTLAHFRAAKVPVEAIDPIVRAKSPKLSALP